MEDNVTCIILNNQRCLARPMFIDLNLDELCYYSFVFSSDRFGAICNTFDDMSDRLCVFNDCKYLMW